MVQRGSVGTSPSQSAADYEAAFAAAVAGQERPVQTAALELRMIKAGLNDPGKPASVMLFAGMTGMGSN